MSPGAQGDRLFIAAKAARDERAKWLTTHDLRPSGRFSMLHSTSPEAAPRRRLWPLFLVSALAIALLGAWTGVWFYVAAQVKAEIAGWRERERHAGRAQDCASLSVRGYPFRMEVRCAGASFELEGIPAVKLDLPAAL